MSKQNRSFPKFTVTLEQEQNLLVQSKLNCPVRLEVKPNRTHQQKGIKKVKKGIRFYKIIRTNRTKAITWRHVI
jgi:hypothetical protein